MLGPLSKVTEPRSRSKMRKQQTGTNQKPSLTTGNRYSTSRPLRLVGNRSATRRSVSIYLTLVMMNKMDKSKTFGLLQIKTNLARDLPMSKSDLVT